MNQEEKEILELWEKLPQDRKRELLNSFLADFPNKFVTRGEFDKLMAELGAQLEAQHAEELIAYDMTKRTTRSQIDKHRDRMIIQFKKERDDTIVELFDGALRRVWPAAILIAKAMLKEAPEVEPKPNRVRYDGPEDPLFLPLWIYYNEVLENKKKEKDS